MRMAKMTKSEMYGKTLTRLNQTGEGFFHTFHAWGDSHAAFCGEPRGDFGPCLPPLGERHARRKILDAKACENSRHHCVLKF